MDSTQEFDKIFLAPDVELSEDQHDLAYELFKEIVPFVVSQRLDENAEAKGIIPYVEISKSLAHWRYNESCLNTFRSVLAECMGDSEKISTSLIALSQTIAAFNSIEEQMYLIYCNLFKIHYELFSDDDLYEQIVEEAQKQARKAQVVFKEWLQEEEKKHPLEFKQLSLDFEVAA